MPWSRRSFLTILAFGVATACQRRPAPLPLTIGLLVPLTGEAAITDGEPTVQAAELALEHLNAQGGVMIAGQPRLLEMVVQDITDSPDQAVAAARELVNDPAIVAIVGFPISRTAIPVAKFLDAVPLPALSTTSTNPETTANTRYIFRVAFVDDFQGRVLAQFARETLQANTAALLYDVSSVYNQGLAATFESAFGELGGQIVAAETYTGDRADDFRPQLQQIKAQAPDVLLLPNYLSDLRLQTQQVQELGLDVTLLGGDAWDDFQLEPSRSRYEGAYYTTMWHADRTREPVVEFLRAYEAAYGDAPNVNAVLAYDAIHLLAQALESQGKTEPDAIRQGLANLQGFQGVSGTISYTGTGDPNRTVFVLQIQDGQATLAQQILPS
ncbi:MAG: ABC transporter substrate-binding protein [Cyanobacteria bacterium P01_G01_bin.54]